MDGKEHGAGCTGRYDEKRACLRYPVDEDSVLAPINHGLPLKARILNLSLEGCRLSTRDRFACKPGWLVEITFKVKGFAFRFSGVVQWSDGRRLLGIHFENMSERRKTDLVELMEEMATAAARTQAVDPSVIEHKSATEALSGISQTVEAKLFDPQGAKASKLPVNANSMEPPARALTAGTKPPAESEPQAHRPAKSRERRGQLRLAVDSSATIFLVKVGSALRGHIADLSLSGCRICTDERFPVGIYTRVETEFHLQGLAFRLGGVIQAIHNRNTVGIRFLDLSERKRRQVLDLIGEIEETRGPA